MTITNTHILRLATKLDPSVSKKVTGSIPATSAVTIAAIIIIKIESNFNTNPITTIRIPNNFNNSILFHSLFHISYRNLHSKLYHILQEKQKKWIIDPFTTLLYKLLIHFYRRFFPLLLV